jgi:hypothetical protein
MRRDRREFETLRFCLLEYLAPFSPPARLEEWPKMRIYFSCVGHEEEKNQSTTSSISSMSLIWAGSYSMARPQAVVIKVSFRLHHRCGHMHFSCRESENTGNRVYPQFYRRGYFLVCITSALGFKIFISSYYTQVKKF